jgi:hypothetical protein
MSRLITSATVAAVLLAGALSVTQAQASRAQAGAWCAQQPGEAGGIFDCSYATFEQCRAFIHGVSNFCLRNPYVVEVREVVPRKRVKRRYY